MTAASYPFDEIAERYPGAGTLVKGIQIIELLAGNGKPMTSSQLMKATQLSKATLYRLLAALVEFRYLQHDERLKLYSLGPRFIELGQTSLSAFDLRTAGDRELERLAVEIGETTSIVVLDGDSIMYIDSRRGPHPLAVGIEVGRRVPALHAASAQAILANLPPYEVNAHLARLSTDDRAHLMAELAICRARGYAIAPSQSIGGVIIISAAVQGSDRGAHGALAVAARIDRVSPERQHTIGRDLMEASRRITGNIGAASVSITPNPRPSLHVAEGLVCVLPAGAIVGEGPVWNSREGRLDWVDVLAPSIHSFDPVTGRDQVWHSQRLVSAVLPTTGPDRVLLTQNGLERLDFATGAIVPLLDPEAHLTGNRFNDAKCDRKGRIWAGTMGLDASMPTGSLYRFDGARSAHVVDGGFKVSNGMGWSPDDKTFYFTDSGLQTVFSYDFDLEAGTVSNRRVFASFPRERGKPDGLAVDAEGFVWIAMWDGWQVVRYAPDGCVDREVDLPVPRPTSCCFGGADLRTLYITSARVRLPRTVLDEAPLSGGIFSLPVDVGGQPTVEFIP
jgi:sugar lactone lactonase YvrE/DNA-binding IclR family transcriptional regulator